MPKIILCLLLLVLGAQTLHAQSADSLYEAAWNLNEYQDQERVRLLSDYVNRFPDKNFRYQYSCSRLGEFYNKQVQYDSVIKFYTLALQQEEPTCSVFVVRCNHVDQTWFTAYDGIGTAYYRKGVFDSAAKYLVLKMSMEPGVGYCWFDYNRTYVGERWLMYKALKKTHRMDEGITYLSLAYEMRGRKARIYRRAVRRVFRATGNKKQLRKAWINAWDSVHTEFYCGNVRGLRRYRSIVVNGLEVYVDRGYYYGWNEKSAVELRAEMQKTKLYRQIFK